MENDRQQRWDDYTDAELRNVALTSGRRAICAMSAGGEHTALELARNAASAALELQDRQEHLDYLYSQAREQIEKIINDLEDLLPAALEARTTISGGHSSEQIAKAMDPLDDHTDGYWHKIIVGNGSDAIHELKHYLADIEERDRVAIRRDEENAPLVKPQPPSNGRLDGIEI